MEFRVETVGVTGYSALSSGFCHLRSPLFTLYQYGAVSVPGRFTSFQNSRKFSLVPLRDAIVNATTSFVAGSFVGDCVGVDVGVGDGDGDGDAALDVEAVAGAVVARRSCEALLPIKRDLPLSVDASSSATDSADIASEDEAEDEADAAKIEAARALLRLLFPSLPSFFFFFFFFRTRFTCTAVTVERTTGALNCETLERSPPIENLGAGAASLTRTSHSSRNGGVAPSHWQK
jgi:hypothetical protein